jgi:hypothetical protein
MNYDTAYARWAGVGPYYAMFPISFVQQKIERYTNPGQRVLDPFAGRASSIFAGAAHGRPSVGIEINPVGWIYGKTKLSPAPADSVEARAVEIAELAGALPADAGGNLPEFFKLCFAKNTLRFLLAARENLDWRRTRVDRTLMALILVDLHGVRSRSFSNQMRQSKAMSPDYSVNWWRARRLKPPRINPEEFLKGKIRWRYARGVPQTAGSSVYLGDSCRVMLRVREETRRKNLKPFKLLVTSPPYIGISDYHRDQWLRLWMLGGKPAFVRSGEKNKSAFASEQDYRDLLNNVFLQAAEVMSKSGYVYVRTDARGQTFNVTREALAQAFPRWREKIARRPYSKQTQTALYGDRSEKPGERDILLTGPRA